MVKVYDTGSDDGTYFIVMEYVQGQTLLRVITDEAPLAPERAAGIARDVASAMAVAHAEGIVHRDIKPANIMITPAGEVRVMDFGIARAVRAESVTQTATVLGTATYFSPEQAQGQAVDARPTSTRLASCSTRCSPRGRPSPGRPRWPWRTST